MLKQSPLRDDTTLLSDFLEPYRPPQVAVPESPVPGIERAPAERPARGRRQSIRTTRYDRWTRIGGPCVALLLCVCLWWVGAYFTLAWLRQVELFGVGTMVAQLGSLAYLIPVCVTVLEVGLWPARNREASVRIAWFSVMGWDAFTSAAGIAVIAIAEGLPLNYAWILGILGGVMLALVPEKAARNLYMALRSTI